jgi:hypothetical protein
MTVKQKYTVVIDQFEKKRAVISDNIVDGKMEEIIDTEEGIDIIWSDIEELFEVEVVIEVQSFDDFACEYKLTIFKDGVEIHNMYIGQSYSAYKRNADIDYAYGEILFYFHLDNVLSDYGLWHILDGVEA